MSLKFTASFLAALSAAALTLSCGTAHKAAVSKDTTKEQSDLKTEKRQLSPEADSIVFAKLDEYLRILDYIDIDAATAEADGIIAAVPDSALRNRVGIKVYEHFRDSKFMGADNIAVHIFDRWFAPCALVFDELDEFDAADFHALVNRRSLLGEKAAGLSLQDMEGNSVSFPAEGRKCAIFFYSTECATCLLTARELKAFIEKNDPDIDLYTICTGSDETAWHRYVELNFKPTCSHTRIYNLSGGDADYIFAYAVIKTPRLFLVEDHGIIAGRNLDADALSRLLDVLCE